jgi:hypothetical protein
MVPGSFSPSLCGTGENLAAVVAGPVGFATTLLLEMDSKFNWVRIT